MNYWYFALFFISNLNEYENKQSIKLQKRLVDIKIWDQEFEKQLSKRLQFHAYKSHINLPILCIGSRLGGEVRAFRNVTEGLVIGIDFNPGLKNPYVMYGDAHNIMFPNSSFGTIYTNILDHILDHARFFDEVSRVLRVGGTFLVDIDQNPPDAYAVHNLKKEKFKIEKMLRTKFKLTLKKNIYYGEKDTPKSFFIYHKQQFYS